MNTIYPFLPWITLGLIAYLILLRLSLSYSRDTVAILKAIGNERCGDERLNQIYSSLSTSAIDSHKRIIIEHLLTLLPDQRLDSLIIDAARTKFLRHMELIYDEIHQSQIRFLRELNTHPNPILIESAKNYFDAAAKQHPSLGKADFSSWFGFLTDHKLVVGKENALELGPLGFEFILWMVSQKIKDKNHE